MSVHGRTPLSPSNRGGRRTRHAFQLQHGVLKLLHFVSNFSIPCFQYRSNQQRGKGTALCPIRRTTTHCTAQPLQRVASSSSHCARRSDYPIQGIPLAAGNLDEEEPEVPLGRLLHKNLARLPASWLTCLPAASSHGCLRSTLAVSTSPVMHVTFPDQKMSKWRT